MKIGVDAVPLQKISGGIGYYLYHLLDELIQLRPQDEFILFTTSDIDHFKKYPNVTIHQTIPLWHSLWSQTILSWACYRTKIDIFWGPAQSIPLLKRPSMKTILTQHDFVFRLHPKTMTFFRKWYLKLLSPFMLKKASAVVAVSQGTASKMAQYYGITPTAIIQPPIKNLSTKPKSHYLITIGTLEPRKNFEELLDVYVQQLEKTDLLPLIIVGSGGWKNQSLLVKLRAKLRQHQNHIIRLGQVADQDLGPLLSGARYCILMSKYEGYGMPLAEARSCGTMPICTDLEEMREACENDGIFLSPITWKKDIIPYFLPATPIQLPKPPTYPSNRTKAMRLSQLLL